MYSKKIEYRETLFEINVNHPNELDSSFNEFTVINGVIIIDEKSETVVTSCIDHLCPTSILVDAISYAENALHQYIDQKLDQNTQIGFNHILESQGFTLND